MKHTKYTKFSERFKKHENEKETEEIKMVNEDPIDEMKEEMVNEIKEEIVNSIEEQMIMGSVIDCEKLNIREQPNKEANVLYILRKSEVLQVLDENATPDFCKVCTASGIEGYCMKRFIKIK